jgi:cold shock CspA family protein
MEGLWFNSWRGYGLTLGRLWFNSWRGYGLNLGGDMV